MYTDTHTHAELFTLRQQFFTGELTDVSKINADDYGVSENVALEYKLRSLMLLGQFSEATTQLKSVSGVLGEALGLYAKLLQGKDVSSQFESLISKHKSESIVQILGTFYLIKQSRADDAIALLQYHENSLECVLLLVQLLLQQNKLAEAEKEVTKASSYAQDSIIFNLAEAYVNAAKNGESLRGSLYFFEELSHSHPTFKTLLGDLVLNLQLHQFPEADEVLRKISELQGNSPADLIANEYAYAQIKGDAAQASEKINQLTQLDGQHPVVIDYKEKSSLFDSIVDKYKELAN